MQTETFYDKARFFASAKAGVREFASPPEEGFQHRFMPTLGGSIVRLQSTPLHGYSHAADARYAAEIYRGLCRDALNT
jgi:hypothetical protein